MDPKEQELHDRYRRLESIRKTEKFAEDLEEGFKAHGWDEKVTVRYADELEELVDTAQPNPVRPFYGLLDK